MSITTTGLTKRFGNFLALDHVSVEARAGDLTALLGPSGCGKTTLLRIIAGLESADEGQVDLEGETATAKGVRERNVGFVFQHYALFRHMTIFENIAFGLRVRKRPRAEVDARVNELLDLVQLTGQGRRYPAQLSGGQRQRVALARALAARPKVLLLDEPFGALDAMVRKELRRWLRRLHDEIHVTSLFVTHDQEEALEVADRVVVMNHGRVEQVGTPDEVYHRPANPFVLSFLGQVNVFHGRARADALKFSDGSPANSTNPASDGNVAAYARPHEMDLVLTAPPTGGTRGRVAWIHRAGANVKIELAPESPVPGSAEMVMIELTQERFDELHIKPGDTAWAIARTVRVFEGDWQI